MNQATSFTQGAKRVECVYDYLNRRVEKAVYEGEILMSKKRYLYNGYLQIAELDAMNASETVAPVLRKTYLWDPMEPIATRVLAMSVYDETGTYVEDLYFTHDALKNTTALFGIQAGRRALYAYAPYGSTVKMEGSAAEVNPFRFSSEYFDDETGLVQYNYRYYNPKEGRWISRDPLGENILFNVYQVSNDITYDILGLYSKEILDFFKINCRCLLFWSREYSVPPEAVAMAIGDEFSERGITDIIQDSIAILGEGGSETVLGRGDIGVGNINVNTAIDLLKDEMSNLGFEFQSKQQMKAYLLTVQGTMHVASAYMAKVIDHMSPYIPDNMSEADKYQNYVAGWREGYEKRTEKMRKNKEKKKDNYIPIHNKGPKQAQKDYDELHDIVKNCLR